MNLSMATDGPCETWKLPAIDQKTRKASDNLWQWQAVEKEGIEIIEYAICHRIFVHHHNISQLSHVSAFCFHHGHHVASFTQSQLHRRIFVRNDPATVDPLAYP